MCHVSTNPVMDVARHLSQAFASRADEADRAGRLPEADVRALRQAGYLTISIPRDYGGVGLSLQDCVAAQIEIAQGSASTAMVAGMPIHLFGNAREQKPWPEEQFASFCRQVVEEGAIFNAIASEPTLGSPSRGGGFRSYAEPTPDGAGWVVNGHKTWSTGGQHLSHMLVRVSIDGGSADILIPQGTPGIRWEPTWQDALSLRASDSHDVFFEHVIVPKENLIEQTIHNPGPNVWFPMIMSAIYLGAAIAARNTTIQFALERVPSALGRPISTLPKIQRQIGEMDIALQSARAFFLQTAGEWQGNNDARDGYLPRVAAAKLIVTQAANHVTELALQVAGGQSITHNLPLERCFRDVRAGSMQPPSGDTALELVGRAAIDDIRPRVSGN